MVNVGRLPAHDPADSEIWWSSRWPRASLLLGSSPRLLDRAGVGVPAGVGVDVPKVSEDALKLFNRLLRCAHPGARGKGLQANESPSRALEEGTAGTHARHRITTSPGAADIETYELDELLGTKLRALSQRKKGRDLFDLVLALEHGAFRQTASSRASRGTWARRAHGARERCSRRTSRRRRPTRSSPLTGPLLAHGRTWSFDEAFDAVRRGFVERLPGDPWKGS